MNELTKKPVEGLSEREIALEARKLVEEALTNEFMAGVKSVIHGIFFNACVIGIKNKLKMETKLPRLKNVFYSKLDSIELLCELDGFREKLMRYQEQYYGEKVKEGVATSALSRVKRGYTFLLQFDDHEMMYQARLVSLLILESTYFRSAVVSYYKRMKEYTVDFNAYPNIPKKVTTYRSIAGKLPPV